MISYTETGLSKNLSCPRRADVNHKTSRGRQESREVQKHLIFALLPMKKYSLVLIQLRYIQIYASIKQTVASFIGCHSLTTPVDAHISSQDSN